MEKEKLKAKSWRTERNLTQQDVADLLGVSKPTVVKWENEDKELPTLVRYALAKLYAVDVNQISS